MTFKIHDGVEIDGKSLTNSGGTLTWGGVSVGSGGGVTISSNANNRVLTGDGSNAVAETNLTFDGTNLQIVGSTRSLITEKLRLGATDTSYIERDSTVNIGYRADGVHRFWTYNGSWLERAQITDSGLTVTGSVTAGTSFELPSSGMLDWANGDARIVEGLVNNYSLSFQTWDGSTASTALRLDGNNAATFAGTIASSNITVTTNSDSAVGLTLKRYSSTGRAQFVLADESGSHLWRVGATGAGGTTFAFYSGSANVLELDRTTSIATFASHVNIGTLGTTGTGTLYLNGSTANKRGELTCTNGNIHIDADDGNGLYLNWYGAQSATSTAGTYFGNANAGQVARIDGSGNFTLSGTVDGVDIAARNSVLTSTTTTANAALPKAGGTMTGTLTTGGNIVVPSNTGVSTTGDWVKVTTNHGYIQIGPANTSHAHIYTDRSNFYFNKTLLYANGNLMWHAGNDGPGSGLDADTLDSLQVHTTQGTQNTANTIVRTQNNGYTMLGWINTTSGATSSTLNKIYCSDDDYIRYQSPANFGVSISPHINYNSIANKPTIPTNNNQLTNGAGYITSANGGNATTLDSLDLHTGRNNEVNKVVRTDSNGYIQAGWINSTSGDMGSGVPTARVYCSNDGYVRYVDLASFRSLVNVTAKTGYQGREQSTSDTNYWVGSLGYGTTTFDNLFKYGSGSIDTWGNPSDQPSGTSHWVGHQHLHYHQGTYGYGHQEIMGAGSPALAFVRGRWGSGSWGSWFKNWNAANDGAGSGLDADLLDGYNAEETAVNNSIVKRDGNADIQVKKLRLTGDLYEGQIVFGTQNSWHSGIRQHDDGDAELRIWHKNTRGRIFIATGYNGEPASIAIPTDGFVLDANNVGIGNFSSSDPSEKLHVKGNILASGNITAYSDIRLKDNLQPIEDAVSKVQKLRGVTYVRNDNEDENRQAGLIAQDVELVLPEAVREAEDGIKTVNYNSTIALLVEAIKEQQEQINQLKKEIKGE